MRREPPVRIREGLGVQFPRVTRLVICCRGTACEAMRVMRSMISKQRLTVNETKTRLCRLPEESVNFLGYTIGLCHSPRTGRSYIGTKPSAKKIEHLKAEIHELTSRLAVDNGRGPSGETEPEASGLVELLLPGPVSPGYRAIDRHTRNRLRQWLRGSTSCDVAGRHGSLTRGCMTSSASSV